MGAFFKNVDYEKFPDHLKSHVDHVVKTDPFPVVPTAYLLSEAGLKGVSRGGARVSDKHPNFIINHAGASSEDVKELIELVRRVIMEKYGIELETEIEYI